MDYYPFGSTLREYNAGSIEANKFKFLGKEKDQETKYFDLGARGYDPDLGRFLQVDPLAESFRSFNPYHYSYNNSIRFSDKTGKAPELFINGDDADEAAKELQKSTDLSLSRDSNSGKVTTNNLSTDEYNSLSDSDKKLYDAIQDKKIQVNVTATTSEDVLVGEYHGSSIDTEGKTQTLQKINVNDMKKIESIAGSTSDNVKHEVLESYIGGQNSPGKPSYNQSDPNYKFAHDQAMLLTPLPPITTLQFSTPGKWGVAPKGDFSKQIILRYMGTK